MRPDDLSDPTSNVDAMTTRDALAAMTSTCTCRKNYGTTHWGTCTMCHLKKP